MSRLAISICLAAFFAIVLAQTMTQSIEQQPKVLMVFFFDESCKKWCSLVRPVIAELKKSYSNQADFVEIDVTQSRLEAAKVQAKELKIYSYLDDVLDNVPEVAIFDSKRKRRKEIVGPKPAGIYEAELKKLLNE